MPPVRPEPGANVGNYLIERRLGRGGQGEVFLARDVLLQRLVALKVFSVGLEQAKQGTGLSEARLIATLDHPGIVRLLHVEWIGGLWYLAMEYIDGTSLDVRVRRLGPLRPHVALAYALAAADALRHAHEVGVIHRDVKPQNLLVSRAGHLKLVDFGLAGFLGGSAAQRIGTPQYMAPETWTGAPASAQTDIYGLGATLFFMLTGRPPFLATTLDAMREAHASAEVALGPEIPAPVAAVVRRCMAKRAEDRPGSADALHKEILQAIATLSGKRQRPAPQPGSTPSWERPLLNRALGDAAADELPPIADARRAVLWAASAGASLIAVHGGCAEIGKRIAASALESAAPRVYLALRIVLGPGDTLRQRLAERLDLEAPSADRFRPLVLAALAPDESGEKALPGAAAIEVERPLAADEIADLVALAAAGAGRALFLLIAQEGVVAAALEAAAQAAGCAEVVRAVEVPALSAAERSSYLATWTAGATGSRVRWTPDALLLGADVTAACKVDVNRLAHNAVQVASALGTALVTTFCVMGGAAHHRRIQGPGEVLPPWQSRPAQWPTEELLARLARLRAERALGDSSSERSSTCSRT